MLCLFGAFFSCGTILHTSFFKAGLWLFRSAFRLDHLGKILEGITPSLSLRSRHHATRRGLARPRREGTTPSFPLPYTHFFCCRKRIAGGGLWVEGIACLIPNEDDMNEASTCNTTISNHDRNGDLRPTWKWERLQAVLWDSTGWRDATAFFGWTGFRLPRCLEKRHTVQRYVHESFYTLLQGGQYFTQPTSHKIVTRRLQSLGMFAMWGNSTYAPAPSLWTTIYNSTNSKSHLAVMSQEYLWVDWLDLSWELSDLKSSLPSCPGRNDLFDG